MSRQVEITATVIVNDVCDPNPTVALTSVVSNEPDDAKGNGDGRVYTITYTATDASGNIAMATATAESSPPLLRS